MIGSSRTHDESSESQSAISGNITINAQSQSGRYSRDVEHANKALANKFDAQKLQNQLQASQLGTQLVGQVVGSVADALGTKRDSFGHVVKAGVPGFDDGKLSDNWARIILEGGANAAVAALTGGNPTVAGAATAAGKVASISAAPAIGRLSASIFKDDSTAITFGNALDNVLAGASGAAVGAAIGGHQGAWNGAVTASIIQQYNDAVSDKINEAVARKRISDSEAALYKNHAAMVRAAAAYMHAFPEDDPSQGFWNADGSVNMKNNADKDYHLPTEDELRKEGIDGYEGLRKLLYHPIDPMNGKPTDLVGALYIPNDIKDKATPVSVVYRGTDASNLRQLQEDFFQNIGSDGSGFGGKYSLTEYRVAQDIAIKLSNTTWAKNGHMMFNGKSLGGGLAIVSSRVTGIPAYVTNSASVNDYTYVYKNGDSSINAVYVGREFLHSLQSVSFYVTVFGHPPVSGRSSMITPPVEDNVMRGVRVDHIDPAESDEYYFVNQRAFFLLHYASAAYRAVVERLNKDLEKIK